MVIVFPYATVIADGTLPSALLSVFANMAVTVSGGTISGPGSTYSADVSYFVLFIVPSATPFS